MLAIVNNMKEIKELLLLRISVNIYFSKIYYY